MQKTPQSLKLRGFPCFPTVCGPFMVKIFVVTFTIIW